MYVRFCKFVEAWNICVKINHAKQIIAGQFYNVA